MNLDIYNKAIVAYEEGKYKTALQLFSKSLDDGEVNNVVFSKIARCYLGLADLESAISEARKAVVINSSSQEALYVLAVSLSYKQEFDDAKEYIKHAFELDKKSPLVHYGQGIVFMNQGKFDLSVEALNHALEYDHSYWRSNVMLAEVYQRTGNINKAIDQIRNAFKIKKSSQILYQWLALMTLKYSSILRFLNIILMLVLIFVVSPAAILVAVISASITLLGAFVNFKRGKKSQGVLLLLFGLSPVIWYIVRLITN